MPSAVLHKPSKYQKRILIVEDDRDIRESMIDVLHSEGFEVHYAINGHEALVELKAERQKPDLIFLDLMMPIIDGFRFREEQALDPAIAHIPVVIMTADGYIESKVRRLGAKSYLRKPIEIDELLVSIRNSLPVYPE